MLDRHQPEQPGCGVEPEGVAGKLHTGRQRQVREGAAQYEITLASSEIANGIGGRRAGNQHVIVLGAFLIPDDDPAAEVDLAALTPCPHP